jgi:solute carrier family 25 protein 38
MGQNSSDTQVAQLGAEGSQTAKKSKLASVVSGSMSGAIVSSCVQPLDVVRTKMQADSAHGVTRTTAQTITLIAKQGGGLMSFWRGTQPTVIRLAIGAGLHFSLLESIKPWFEKRNPDGTVHMDAVGAALTGGLSRGLAAMISCPITLVKTRMEYVPSGGSGISTAAVLPQYRNTVHALSTIAREEGIRGLYRGLGPTILANAPFSALYYTFYTRLQERLRRVDSNLPNPAINFASGTLAAVAATLITQPADVVRTRVQLGLARGSVTGAGGGVRGGASIVRVLQHIAASQGYKGMLVGAAPRILKRTLQTALVWTLYEELMPRLTKASDWAGRKIKDT